MEFISYKAEKPLHSMDLKKMKKKNMKKHID